jgi:hypothetical protein
VAKLVGRNELEGHISYLPGVGAELRKEAERIEGIADRKLQIERSTTQWRKYDRSTAHLTEVRVEAATGRYSQDYLVVMEGPNAWAFEYGHAPSGIFAGTNTQPPKGTYLMTMTYVQA